MGDDCGVFVIGTSTRAFERVDLLTAFNQVTQYVGSIPRDLMGSDVQNLRVLPVNTPIP